MSHELHVNTRPKGASPVNRWSRTPPPVKPAQRWPSPVKPGPAAPSPTKVRSTAPVKVQAAPLDRLSRSERVRWRCSGGNLQRWCQLP